MKKKSFTLAEGATHVGIFKNSRKKAFTLAEVLITLTVIGVVAAITLPPLIQNYQKQVLVNQLKKSYSTLTNGFKLMLADDGVDNIWDTDLFKSHATLEYAGVPGCIQNFNNAGCEETKALIKKYFKVENINDSYIIYQFNGSKHSFPFITNWLLSDGALIFIEELAQEENISVAECSRYKAENNSTGCTYAGGIYIDVNGKKKPNRIGRDIFYYFLDNQGNLCYTFNDDSNDDSYYTARIMRDGWKMNY